MRFVRFNQQNLMHKSGGSVCLICNKKVHEGVVVYDVVGPLLYCARCVRRLALALSGKTKLTEKRR